MKTIRCVCPGCAQPFEMPQTMAGTPMSCPQCGQGFMVDKPKSRARDAIVIVCLIVTCSSLALASSMIRRHHSLGGQSPSAKETVIGAFGFNLGEKLPQNFEVKTDSLGWLSYSPEEFTNTPPFTYIFAKVNDERTIVSVHLGTTIVDPEVNIYESWWALQKVLDQKYGESARRIDGDDTTVIYGKGNRVACVYFDKKLRMLSVEYIDEKLNDAAMERARALKEAKARQALGGL
jgi:hypothetical protein